MKLVLEKAGDFKKSIDAISVLIGEAEFVLSKEGLFLKATDPSQISMVDFEIKKSHFKQFSLEKETKIGLDLDYLSQIMNRSKPKDELVLELDEKNSRLKIVFKNGSKRKFSVPLIDISSAELPSPKIDFEAELKLKAELLQDGLKDASLVSTHVSLGVEAQTFFIRASSSKGDSHTEIEKSEKGVKELKASKECSSMFPLDYLQDMLKAASSETLVSVFLKKNNPVKISYNIGKASVTYFLAPRIETT